MIDTNSKCIRCEWDIIIDNIPYYAYYLVNYLDRSGIFVCPRDKEPTKDNLLAYHMNSPVSWNIVDNSKPSISSKYDIVKTTTEYIIKRNGVDFTYCYDLLDALRFIRDVTEHPMNLNDIDFDKKVVGRKIWWRDEPAIITRFNWGIGTVSFKPDGIDRFTTPKEYEDDVIEYYEDMDSIHTDIWDKHIGWFREE